MAFSHHSDAGGSPFRWKHGLPLKVASVVIKEIHFSNASKGGAMVHCREGLSSEDPARELNNQISELQARVAFPQHWSSGEHEQHIEKLRQLTYEKSRLTDRSGSSPMELTHH